MVPLAERQDVADLIHNVEVSDPYRWLEQDESPQVSLWDAMHTKHFIQSVDDYPERDWLAQRFDKLWRYDDESVPRPCRLSPRTFYSTKAANQDKWVLHLRENPEEEGRLILDPNTWEETETLAGTYPSPDCRYLAYGKARAGDENPVIAILDLDSMELLEDSLSGWKQGGVSWLHDNSGFFYDSWPAPGTVPKGDQFYFHRTSFHPLNSDGSEDEVVFADKEVKEHFHGTSISEDGKWISYYRSRFSKNEIYLASTATPDQRLPVATGLDAQHSSLIVNDKLFILTDHEAPRYRVMMTDVSTPEQASWQEFIPEGEDVLKSIDAIDGHLYLTYQHNAASRIAVRTLDGAHVQDMSLPSLGVASVWGFWDKAPVWVSFTSFAHPTTVYQYSLTSNSLEIYKESPIDIDTSNIASEQVWYESKDGTRVSMFLVYPKDKQPNEPIPFLLTGYGGFNISLRPRFSTSYAVWLEAGGGIAIPNLRGGGEYGKEWHEAGMREKKQNVFDDFIAAAEWLFEEGHTSSSQLAIRGGSNGGLLVSAAIAQRPELFQAVLCSVPLTDMIRYHLFGLANIWSEEYGSSEDPEIFPQLLAYSPYHNLKAGVNYPAALIIGSVNDARTVPLHARKFAAALRWADEDHGTKEPILVHIQRASGHGGGVTIDKQITQTSRSLGFLMHQVGLSAPTP
jgi:prolyl oligopeptidase